MKDGRNYDRISPQQPENSTYKLEMLPNLDLTYLSLAFAGRYDILKDCSSGT